MTQPTKTWGGRFTGGTDARVEAFTESISFDARLAEFDIQASQAHARMLAHVGLLTKPESEQINTALNEIKADIEAGRMAYTTSLEDIHTHIEQALIKKLGDVGRKLHTARSRNDQIVTDVKLWTRTSIDQLSIALAKLQQAFVNLASDRRESDSAGIYPFATGAAGAGCSLSAGVCREAGAGSYTAWPTVAHDSMNCLWEQQHSLGHRFRLIVTSLPRNWDLTGLQLTAWISPATAIS
jgi:hypothetical protein